MPIERHRATGWGVFGLKRHVKGGLQECVRATALSGLGLPARILGLSEHGKTADNAAATTDNCADGNTSQNGGSPVPWISGIYASHKPDPSGKGNMFS